MGQNDLLIITYDLNLYIKLGSTEQVVTGGTRNEPLDGEGGSGVREGDLQLILYESSNNGVRKHCNVGLMNTKQRNSSRLTQFHRKTKKPAYRERNVDEYENFVCGTETAGAGHGAPPVTGARTRTRDRGEHTTSEALDNTDTRPTPAGPGKALTDCEESGRTRTGRGRGRGWGAGVSGERGRVGALHGGSSGNVPFSRSRCTPLLMSNCCCVSPLNVPEGQPRLDLLFEL
ncbi:unnamed protein product [Danaus chrysippus]|uniref:(African queen) hypothetical protein n=1 Tax=Danaus chrysippus TaxID=151541 RepID=A0A8J2QJV6_9NEOP|nr:unnamed protein product [Danaus chrysippus]